MKDIKEKLNIWTKHLNELSNEALVELLNEEQTGTQETAVTAIGNKEDVEEPTQQGIFEVIKQL